MYSFIELQFIFQNCQTHQDLNAACSALLHVIDDGDLTKDQINFCREESAKCFIRIETI